MFMLISLLHDKKKEKNCMGKECDVTVLIPVYNSKTSIKKTIDSIKNQKYNGNIYIIIIIDDGSTDGSLELLKSMDHGCEIMLLEICHKGKSFALNEGLKCVRTDYTITIDSDTILHPLAIRCIMNQLVHSNEKTAATAGCLFAQNDKKLCYKTATVGLYFRDIWSKTISRKLSFYLSCPRCL